ncbi:DUF2442 domain-containing protein [Pseudanabaena biceps]|nr:DUF2442 domain-containing protein [Pseudanabaena biceps]
MFLHIVSAHYIDRYRIEIQFSDGRSGIADLADSLKGKVFQSLQDLVLFQQFEVETELRTIRWSNGADFAPEYLYFLAFRDLPELQEQFQSWGYLSPKVTVNV